VLAIEWLGMTGGIFVFLRLVARGSGIFLFNPQFLTFCHSVYNNDGVVKAKLQIPHFVRDDNS